MHRIVRDGLLGSRPPAVAAERVMVCGDTRPHSHDFLEMVVVEAGAGRHITSRGTQPLTAGTAVVIRPGEWHGYESCQRLRVLNCYIGMEVFRGELEWTRSDPDLRRVIWPRQGSPEHERPAAALLPAAMSSGLLPGVTESLVDPRGSGGPHRARLLANALLVIAAIADALLGAEPRASAGEVRSAVLDATRLLESDPAWPWTLTRLATAVHMSEAHLGRLFSEDVGLSPMRYLTRLRAERAAALLLETHDPVSQVAVAVGWPDSNLFARRFRAEFGLSPTQYRRRFVGQ